MRRITVFLTAAMFVVLSSGAGTAEARNKNSKTKKPTRRQKRKARGYELRGNRFKARGDRHRWHKRKKLAMKNYKKAAIVYIASFKLVPRARLVYKLANVYMRRGEVAWALRGYKRYVAMKPAGRAARRSQRFIKRLEVVVRGKRDAGTLEDGDPDIDPTPVFGPAPEPEPKPEPKPEPITKKPIVNIEKPKPAPPGRTYRWAGIGTAGAGVVMLIVGVKFGLDASSAASDLSGNQDAWTDADRQRVADGKSASHKMIAFTLIGSAAVIGGGLLYYYGKKKAEKERRDKRVTWTPVLTPTTVSLAISGRF